MSCGCFGYHGSGYSRRRDLYGLEIWLRAGVFVFWIILIFLATICEQMRSFLLTPCRLDGVRAIRLVVFDN